MSVAYRRAGFVGKISLALGLVTVSAASLCAVTLKPKTFPVKMLGIQGDLPVTIAFDMKTEGDAVALQLGAEASLKSLQDNALQIARALPVPRGNCDRQGINPVVNSIDEASIAPSGDTAVVAIKGHVTAWVCAKPAGITVKTEGPRDSVSISAKVRVAVIDGKQLGLQLAGPVTVKTGSTLTQEAIRLFTGDISASITNALTNALSTEEARAKLPSLPGLEGSITDASFASDGGTLLIRAHGNARMTSETFNSLLDMMNK
ncbi:hypothetical protein [Bradyrhizobium cenepequi]|uniref:hypothetical protein n=1 Tax=Bradyrhizobium cenepequi TaxID=2821403 RepID=UPI001CE34655|nr:hypothetical protein [Bradyrhizobium cenepequi]MCA6108050.1 hypothetical protein [Bradyrhizobium cenepequi]